MKISDLQQNKKYTYRFNKVQACVKYVDKYVDEEWSNYLFHIQNVINYDGAFAIELYMNEDDIKTRVFEYEELIKDVNDL